MSPERRARILEVADQLEARGPGGDEQRGL
jgi:hypothetical protein